MFNIPFADLMSMVREAHANYQPRSSFYDKPTTNIAKDQAFNILAYDNIPRIKRIHDVTSLAGTVLEDVLVRLADLYNTVERLPGSTCFMTFSAPSQYPGCPSHVHHFIEGKPCMTTTFAIPLYVGEVMPTMMITDDSVKRPTRWYLDPARIPSDLEYHSLEISRDRITKFEFNSSYHPHYITYTDSIVMWFVIDGSKHDHDLMVSLV